VQKDRRVVLWIWYYEYDMRSGPKPDIYQHLDYREWLREWFSSQKKADRRFSYRLFARRAGVRSPSLFTEVVSGKRNLTPRTIEGFARACRLTHGESLFFADLVAFDQAETDQAKNLAWERIASTRRFRQARPIEGAMFRYLSNWFIPATRELALRPDFKLDKGWIAGQLRPAVTSAQAQLAISTLQELGMLTQANGRWSPAEVSVATAHEVSGLAAHNYHRQMLQRACDSVTQANPQERHITGVTVAIPVSMVPQLKDELGQAMARLFNLCDAQADQAQVVYQLHAALFPLSHAAKESE